MSSLNALISASQTSQDTLLRQARKQLTRWNHWLQPVPGEHPTGEDPGYDDDFQQMREEVNKLTGADTELVCILAEKLLTTTTKDLRVVTSYCWAKLHREGEKGLADGLELLAGMLENFGTDLYPRRERSRKFTLEWLAGSRILDSLSLYPQVVRKDALRTAGALALIAQLTGLEPEGSRPQLDGLYSVLTARLINDAGPDVVVPPADNGRESIFSPARHTAELNPVTSGQDLLARGRALVAYLQEQPGSWLATHHLMKSLRHDMLQSLPVMTGDGRTRIEPPKADQRALLKRLYLQQSWSEILEQADSLFSRGANHLWLDLQWYIHQGLQKSGQRTQADIIAADLKGLLTRLQGLETLSFNDGTPFADETTRNWIQQHVMATTDAGEPEITAAPESGNDRDVLQLEAEATALAETQGVAFALEWLQNCPGITTVRQKWLLRLLMARVAEQCGKNELAAHLFAELGSQAGELTLVRWEPELLFEVHARHLKLLRIKAGRSEADKARLNPLMEQLLVKLISVDPSRAAVLCAS